MIMKKIIILFCALLSFSSCKYFRGDNCNNTLPVEGIYENIYDKDAKNILVIKEDGTFEQIFTKGSIVKTNKGTWKFFKEYCEIDFKGLKVLHRLGQSEVKFFKQDGVHRLNNIVFVEGMSYEFNYYRVKDK